MKKFIKWTLIILVSLLVIVAIAFPFLKAQTKKNSPETTVVYKGDGANDEITIRYSQPFRKGRTVFGGLVPYGNTWRTGANEATEFTTKNNLQIADKTLPAGKYTLWTIPEKDSWTVIWNSDSYFWGINGKDKEGKDKASRNPEKDVLKIEVPVQILPVLREQFNIAFAKDSIGTNMKLAWEYIQISVPIK